VLVDGVPPGKDHDHEVGVCEDPSVKVTLPPVVTDVGAPVKVAVGGLVIVITVALAVPVTTGVLLTTLIAYAVPATVPAGMVADILPEFAVLDKVPMVVGVVKEPVALDNCAVYIFPALYVPVLVNGTVTAAPVVGVTQKGEPLIVPVVIVGEAVVKVLWALYDVPPAFVASV
jgi:hypothetical protein